MTSSSTLNDAAAVLTLAFAADPPARWMYPSSHQYFTNFPRFVEAFAGSAFGYGSVDTLADCPAVALWLPPGMSPDEEAIVRLLQNSVSADRQGDLFAFFEQMGNYHPAEPHWYLPLIGVDPTLQGTGRGSELLKKGLARADSDQLPAYLEATNPRNRALYERFGFKSIGEIQAGSSPCMYPMVREPVNSVAK